jgi:alanyl-tRNA synthetase
MCIVKTRSSNRRLSVFLIRDAFFFVCKPSPPRPHRIRHYPKELVDEDVPTVIRTLPADEARSLCGERLAKNFDPNVLRADALVRVVTVAGWHAPCGGTHVRSTGELRRRGWSVRGLRCKKGAVRVRYGPAEED